MASSCELSPSEQDQIQQWATAHGTPQQVALRCQIVLAAAEGQSDVAIAERLSVNRKTVILWRTRFSEQRLEGLWEIAPGRGRKPTYSIDKIAAIVEATLQTKPEGMTHWSCRTMAQSQGISKSTISSIWQAHNLKPHRVETFKLSRDPKFLEKMTDVIGLYLNPPQEAIVYKRNGTTTLFAALDILQGKVIGQCYQRHRNQEFLKFLRMLENEFPGKVPLHLIIDNYGTHKHENVRTWLKRHPRFVLHFVPTSSSWLNLVERWFGELDNKAIRRGVFRSVEDLKASIDAFLVAWNKDPKPYVWTATVESITEKLSRCRQTLEKIQPGCTSPRTRKRKK